MSVDEKMTAIADSIRSYTGISDKLNLDSMATGVSVVYGNGRTEGYKEGHNEGLSEGREQGYSFGFEEGKQAEYGAFWDVIQRKGNPTNYQYAFAYNRFIYSGVDAYNPKYDINIYDNVATAGTYAFAQSTQLTDTKVAIYANKHSISAMFTGCTKLKTIRKLALQESTAVTSAFANCTALEELNIEGVIGQSGFDVHWSTNLKTASIVSIVEALSDSASGLSVTLSQVAVNNMVFPFTSERTGITYNSWSELEGTKTNWTISLS